VATSTVSITSPEAAKFFLEEKYAIGQTFRVLGRVAEFKLLEVLTSPASQEGEEMKMASLKRRYTLRTDGFVCDIEVRILSLRHHFTLIWLWLQEVFPDRSMFDAETVHEWLAA
jgi:hypothetical protein